MRSARLLLQDDDSQDDDSGSAVDAAGRKHKQKKKRKHTHTPTPTPTAHTVLATDIQSEAGTLNALTAASVVTSRSTPTGTPSATKPGVANGARAGAGFWPAGAGGNASFWQNNGTGGGARFGPGGFGPGDGRNKTGFPGDGIIPGLFNRTGDHPGFNGTGDRHGFNGSGPGLWNGADGNSMGPGDRGRKGPFGGFFDKFGNKSTPTPTPTPTTSASGTDGSVADGGVTVVGGLRRLRESDLAAEGAHPTLKTLDHLQWTPALQACPARLSRCCASRWCGALRCAHLLAGLPTLAAEIAARLADKAERMSDPASGGKEFWSAVREANWQLPPNWELPQPVVGLTRRSLSEARAYSEGEHAPHWAS